jgi:membrane associated rhomboid family serine protease
VVVVLQRRVPTVTVALIALTLAVTIGAAFDARHGGGLVHALLLRPEAVWRGEVWRLATWPFLHGSSLALLFTCVTLLVFGSDLCVRWGRARYLRYLGGVVLAAGLGTSLLAFVLPDARWFPYAAGLVPMHAITIAWARQFPAQPVAAYLLLVVQGPALVQLTIAITLIFAFLFGLIWALPELIAVAAALLYMDRPHRRWWLAFRLWRAHRRLRVVRG